jgi:hypothetical protein
MIAGLAQHPEMNPWVKCLLIASDDEFSVGDAISFLHLKYLYICACSCNILLNVTDQLFLS